MSFEGTVVNGTIVLDGGPQLPDGVRVRVEFADELGADDFPPPPATETYEEHLAALRESAADMRAGVPGIDACQFLKELAVKHGLPLLPGE
ncbi:MAG: hypothetical protein ACRC7O_08940 [Fimbriiglobus sp.]